MTTFILLGDVKVALFDATAARRVSADTAPIGTIGIVEDLAALVSEPDVEALFTSDVTFSEGHSVNNVITTYKVEQGADNADHVKTDPRVITISGLITDTPSGLESFFVVPELINKLSEVPRRIQAFKRLENLALNRSLLDVTTSYRIYQNMIIQNITMPRSTATGNALFFDLTLQELLFSTSQIVTNSSLDGFGTTDLGTQTTTPFSG